MYSIEGRAIPSLVDGFKPSQRKVIHVSNLTWKTGNEKVLKIFQLSGKVASEVFYHHGDCLDANTEIILTDGRYITIGDWCDNFPDQKFEVLCYDEKKEKFTSGIGHSPRIGSVTKEEYEIEMEDGTVVKCTSNHPFLTQRGWVQAKDLLETDDIKNFN
jgi:hypothetical protein